MTLQWHRIVPHSSEGQGLDGHAEPLPEQPLDTVWLDE